MENNGLDDWEIDVAQGSALHSSGFKLYIEGDPREPSSVAPTDCPSDLNAVDQARLLREGMAALAKAAGPRKRTGPTIKTKAQQTAEARAKLFAERADKPDRPRLSLKKNKG